uniref:Solute carrier family 40 member n=1 Tax=Timema genevievae TaxID=629358 RepID=A0A7R9PQ63_TIMGE|nr:unnamed protein product [Timema genevievae]
MAAIQKLRDIKPARLYEGGQNNQIKKAAVLVPLCIVNGEVSLLYTVRSPDLKRNSGQVSFPGGLMDKTDKDLQETALRETFEELGIQKSSVQIWGHGLHTCLLEVAGTGEPSQHYQDHRHGSWWCDDPVRRREQGNTGARKLKRAQWLLGLILVSWVHGFTFKIYCCSIFSSWGDRMWWFAGGIFMKDLSGVSNDNLLLTGGFTLALSGFVVLFGSHVGRWVDKSPRLKAAGTALVTQNLLLVICVTLVGLTFYFWEDILPVWHGWLLISIQTAIVLTAAFSQVASVALQIILQKDWIIILCGGDLNKLAKVNSMLRTINLGTQVLAPIFVGVVQDQVSKLACVITIGVWNVISMVAE